MRIFLTFNDYPGGIYSSQVIDVCRYLREITKQRLLLVAFVSMRNYFSARRAIKLQDTTAVVLPMFPGIRNWRMNSWMLRLVLFRRRPEYIVARGPFATLLAANINTVPVCFDARGAYWSEFKEFDVSNGSFTADEIRKIESEALRKCKTAIAVSEALVNYWRSEFNYTENKHAVIPCTLRSDFRYSEPTSNNNKIRIVFAGGSGPWQNLTRLSELLLPVFNKRADISLTLMVKNIPADFELAKQFPERVTQKWVSESEVPQILSQCDYGWLVRDDSITNKVASPVKFAEYLAAGLRIIISESLGDFSEFVSRNNCGVVLTATTDLSDLEKVSSSEKARIASLTKTYFVKNMYSEQYRKVLCV